MPTSDGWTAYRTWQIECNWVDIREQGQDNRIAKKTGDIIQKQILIILRSPSNKIKRTSRISKKFKRNSRKLNPKDQTKWIKVEILAFRVDRKKWKNGLRVWKLY